MCRIILLLLRYFKLYYDICTCILLRDYVMASFANKSSVNLPLKFRFYFNYQGMTGQPKKPLAKKLEKAALLTYSFYNMDNRPYCSQQSP